MWDCYAFFATSHYIVHYRVVLAKPFWTILDCWSTNFRILPRRAGERCRLAPNNVSLVLWQLTCIISDRFGYVFCLFCSGAILYIYSFFFYIFNQIKKILRSRSANSSASYMRKQSIGGSEIIITLPYKLFTNSNVFTPPSRLKFPKPDQIKKIERRVGIIAEIACGFSFIKFYPAILCAAQDNLMFMIMTDW